MNFRSLGILCGCFALCVGSARAQDPKTGVKPAVIDEAGGQVQKLVIVNGTQPQVRYVGKNLSSSEQSLLRELEQAETELALSRQAEQDRLDAIAREEAETREKAAMRMQVMKTAAALPSYTTSTSFKETPQSGNAITNFLTPFTFSAFGSGGGGGFIGGVNSSGGSTLTSAVPGSAAAKNVGVAPINSGTASTAGIGPVAISNGTTSILNNGMNNGINNGNFFGGNGYPYYPPQMNAPPQTPVTTTVMTENKTNTKGLELAAQIAMSSGPAQSSAAQMAAPAPSSGLVRAEANYQAVLSRINQSDALRVAVNGQKAKATITLAGIPDVQLGSSLQVTYKSADKTETVEGQLVREDAMYLVLRMPAGRMSIQKNQITNVLVKE
jgi:hypothetical protein